MSNTFRRSLLRWLLPAVAAMLALALFIVTNVKSQEPAGPAGGGAVNCSSMGDAANHWKNLSESEYLHTVKAVREGLLANLSPETAKKVAYENADRLFGIPK